MENLKIQTQPGDNFDKVVQIAICSAILNDSNAEFDFNGVTVIVDKDSNNALVYRDYSNSWTMGWKTIGPKYDKEYSYETQSIYNKNKAEQDAKRKAEQEESIRKEKQQKYAFEEKVKGIEFEVVNKDGYESLKSKNTDDYGGCIMEYAESWAKLMQYEMAHGKALEDIASKTSYQLGFYGITGFMYGAAVNTLSHYWKHGEALRKWHNKEYGHKGKGVVNPAILSIKSKS
jgi:hypothetical protein